VLDSAPCQKDILGEMKYSSTHPELRQNTEISGQLHAPAALSPRKDTPITIG